MKSAFCKILLYEEKKIKVLDKSTLSELCVEDGEGQVGESDYVYYDRAERFAGESKYPLKKMISFALDGITSFSVKPLKLISNLGILISVLSIFGLLYALISHLCGVTVAGWTAIVASIWLLGGLQMLCLGVVGGYIGKIYSEVKQRPRFLIETHLKAEPEEKVLDEH